VKGDVVWLKEGEDGLALRNGAMKIIGKETRRSTGQAV
jgi:hypothetical protein